MEFEEELEPRKFSALLSVRSVISAICLVAILLSTLTSSVLSLTSCDSALDRMESHGEEGVHTCFRTSSDDLVHLAIEMLEFSSEPSTNVIILTSSMLNQEVLRLRNLVHTTFPSVSPAGSPEFLQGYSPVMHATMEVMGELMPIMGIATKNAANQIQGYVHNRLSPNNVAFSHGGNLMTRGRYVPQNNSYVSLSDADYTMEILFQPSIYTGVVPAEEVWWSWPLNYDIFVGYGISLLTVHPVQGEVILSVTASMLTVSSFLSHSASVARRSGSLMYLYLVQASDWSYGVRPASADQRNYTGALVATSHGNLTRGGSLVLDTEAPDPGIRGIAFAVHDQAGSYLAVHRAARSITELLVTIGTLSEKYFVMVNHIGSGHDRAVDWWFVMAVDEVYVLQNVTSRQDALHADIDSTFSVIRDDVSRNIAVMSGVAVVVAAALTVLSFGITQLVLLPIKHLVEDMHRVAEMDLEAGSGNKVSFLQEVGSMQVSFNKMKRNLVEFRAYMPSNLLQTKEHDDVVAPPSGRVTIMFTDIKSSTMLWQRCASGMNKAMETHNRVIREAIKDNRGYEVKTIGDSFMVAFQEAADAVRCGVQVLEDLEAEDWPVDLMLPTGLKVRIGVNTGEALLEENPLTGRSDYRGTPVNTAARVESSAIAGTLCITQDLYDIVKANINELSHGSVEPFSDLVELKGLEGKYQLYTVSPLKSTPYTDNFTEQQTKKRPSRTSKSSYVESSAGVNLDIMKKTGLFFVSSDLGIAVCKLNVKEDSSMLSDFNLVIAATSEAAVQTSGTLGSVSGNTVVTSWNTSKPCKLYPSAGLRFLAQLEPRCGRFCHIGFATGKGLHGNVGSQKNRFQTIVGITRDAAHLAADSAKQLQVFSFLADCTSALNAGGDLQQSLLYMDTWVHPKSLKPIRVSYVCCENMRHLMENWMVTTDVPNCYVTHNRLYLEALEGSETALAEIKSNAAATGDLLMEAAARRLEDSPFKATLSTAPSFTTCV